MTLGFSGRPFATFCVLGFNQERYIRAAIEGAFAQTYQPLEIILSDDCSSDATFAIMQELAAAYAGPHIVTVRRNTQNRGTLWHLLSAAREARGKVMVVAAGDDISLPQRTERLMNSLCSTDAIAVSSDDIVIDDTGAEQNWDANRSAARDGFHRALSGWVLGSTAAYDLAFLRRLPLPDDPLLFEDVALIDVMGCIGARSLRLGDQLIQYRHHESCVSDRLSPQLSVEAAEMRSMWRWQQVAGAKRYCLDTVATLADGNSDPVSRRRVTDELKLLTHLGNWRHGGPGARVGLVYQGLRQRKASTALLRAFGWRPFLVIRKLQRCARSIRNGIRAIRQVPKADRQATDAVDLHPAPKQPGH